MSEPYQPELGQLIFGHPHQEYEVPEIMVAVLLALHNEYRRVYWNRHKRECFSPFYNSGPEANFKTDVLEVQAYDWGDDEQPYNLAWRDLRISWYKHCERGPSSNLPITPEMAAQCLDECLASIRAMDRKL